MWKHIMFDYKQIYICTQSNSKSHKTLFEYVASSNHTDIEFKLILIQLFQTVVHCSQYSFGLTLTESIQNTAQCCVDSLPLRLCLNTLILIYLTIKVELFWGVRGCPIQLTTNMSSAFLP